MTVREYMEFAYELKGVKQPRQKHLEAVSYTHLNPGYSGGQRDSRQRRGLVQGIFGLYPGGKSGGFHGGRYQPYQMCIRDR